MDGKPNLEAANTGSCTTLSGSTFSLTLSRERKKNISCDLFWKMIHGITRCGFFLDFLADVRCSYTRKYYKNYIP